MNYPLISEYIDAIMSAEDNFDKLSSLRPVLDDDGRPIMSSGNFAVVFKMKDERDGKLYAVKCFTKEQEGRAEAYRQIADELEYIDSNYLTSVRYLDKELFVDCDCEEDEFPVLQMDWVEGETMEAYIAANYHNTNAMAMLCYRFCKMAAWLRSQPFAHGDIKPDNIIVRPDGSLVLVDYDGIFVPVMKGQKSPTVGTKDFSHPLRSEDDFDETIDDFSLAVIALSLKAISLKPSLRDEYGAADRLLFSAEDYQDLSKSEIWKAMQNLANDEDMKILLSMFLLVIAKKNLAMCSFQLFMLKKPDTNIDELIALADKYCEGEEEDYDKAFALYVEAAAKGNLYALARLGVCYVYGDGVEKDEQKGFALIRESAEKGNAEGQIFMGHYYKVIKLNYKETIKWYSKAAEKGNSEGQFCLGLCYYNGVFYPGGLGGERNYVEAVRWFQKSAELGNPKAQYYLGVCYYNGYGVEKDYAEAVKWYRESAEQGFSKAQYSLGNRYLNGEGVEKDYAEAVKWYRKSAEQGNPEAQYNLGVCYANGEGVEKDYAEAVKWWRKSAEQGVSKAQYNLGVCYYNGYGVEKDYAETVKWYHMSAEQGNSRAQYNLGFCYRKGYGVEKDYAEAVKWYRKSAEQRNSAAQNNLGNCYYNGEGVEKNYAEAVKWYCKSAEQGNSNGQKNLGVCYEKGRGVPKSYSEALKWYEKSAVQGNAKAKSALARIKKELGL